MFPKLEVIVSDQRGSALPFSFTVQFLIAIVGIISTAGHGHNNRVMLRIVKSSQKDLASS